MKHIKNISKNQYQVFLIICILLLQSCAVRLISDYDNITDKTVTELQEKVSNYFVKIERAIESEEAKYENFIKQFDEIKVDLNTLEVRAAAIDKNRIIQQQVKELQKMFKNLESLHKLGFNDYEQIRPLKASFNSAFTAIIKLQLALKRGENQNN
ncbi:hypothetical protein IMCC3317_40570 [Kordia antarctica]|uniref:Lipoprotein n=1 Tax=Kordia antarctica TaxID=1218801 RepID=A0A7L4ZPJ1_9FLAO|nr:hypothetical protein [Kordia antarctica]QHI38663.1 hypothetical protein IMCC3317_40570 [Kordia antarctica]